MHKFSLGADPELFLVDAAGAFVASCDLIGGSKEFPLPLPIGNGFAVQEDNVAVEYNIPPSKTKDAFVENIHNTINFLYKEMVATRGLAFSKVSSARFDKMQLLHPKALEFGCDPDYNAWKNGERNPRPSAVDETLRTCGGHVHVGAKFSSRRSIMQFIKYLDLYLGVPSVVMDDGHERKQLYGSPGAFRFKPYGCEYRVLSNFWVHDQRLTGWVWDNVESAMDAWQNKKINIDEIGTDIQDAISKNDQRKASELIDKFNLATV